MIQRLSLTKLELELEIDQWRDRILGRISRRDISQNKSRIGMKRKVF